MIKILFFDNWGLEVADNFTRRLEPAIKHGANPLFIADEPWEEGNMQTYGSVIKLPGKPFQLWYSVTHHKPKNIVLCYAESEDGLRWSKPLFDKFRYKGKKTNIVLDCDVHGPAIIYDAAAKLYRMVAGASPTGCICVFNSTDGIDWYPLNQGPAIANKPDCSMGLVKTRKGQFAAYHRHPSTGRRVCRTTSWDFRFWDSEPKLVFEPDAHDPPQLQFYALGSSMYGSYELGTLWAYHTERTDLATWHLRGQQETELTYNRNGYAWHRAAQGKPFIPHGRGKEWDRGNVQCASQPVFLDDEVRFYYAGSDCKHDEDWELKPHKPGFGLAISKPDRFIALEAGHKEGELLTFAFNLPSSELYLNAKIDPRGSVRVGLLDKDGKPIKGFTAADCEPLQGDSLVHPVRWRGTDAKKLAGTSVRVCLRVRDASVYSIFSPNPGEVMVYHQFNAPF